jgi:hypothetical protein
MLIYMTAVALVIGCRTAERRGSETGCEDGELAGRADGMSDRVECARPEPVPVGCNQQSGGTFRRDKYKDAFEGAFAECYERAYLEQWTYEMWSEDCDGDTGPVDTGSTTWWD